MKFFRRDQTITSKTPPKVARALIESWQNTEEHKLLDAVDTAVLKAQRAGLETRRIGRVLSQFGTALERIGGAPESNGSSK